MLTPRTEAGAPGICSPASSTVQVCCAKDHRGSTRVSHAFSVPMSGRLVVPIRSAKNPQFTLTFGERALNDRAKRNALCIELKRMELAFANLPAEFDGFRILQPSDLHVDFLPDPVGVETE